MNDNTQLNDKKVFLWHGPEDQNRLTAAIAEVAIAELFNMNGGLVWFNEGRAVPVNKDVLREIITRHLVSVRLVSRGEFGLKREFYTFAFPVTADASKEPNERVLIDMAETLLLQVAKGPSAPHRLTAQQLREVRTRLAIGEPRDKLAREYNVEIGAITAAR